ncbi:uncharacterized protein N7525_004596 [Penicillium rubens]|uniref:uncharacterized protein n=1 Tax=Penicillium rubens TaxID=1108849 RepID=UPI002A599D1C|nr:uncharacterized protein N7525_004596 [Penicillium rubens]KAJ5839408.1 hypothetical protein N7525_004596 [Penicillium rubens]KAJ5867460.1 hypothetical protein N7534_002013 [Penicillium rubens]
MERGTEDLNSVGSDSRPSIDSFLYLCNVSVGRNKRERIYPQQKQDVRIRRQMKANWGINHHPSGAPGLPPPLNIQRKNPLVAPTSLSFAPTSIQLTTSPKPPFTRGET